MSTKFLTVVVCAGLSFLAGCSSHRYVVNDPVARPLGSFAADINDND